MNETNGKTGTAIVTGASGQDGYFLVERLLAEGWSVHATARRTENLSFAGPGGIDPAQLHLHRIDLLEPKVIFDLITDTQPDEFYNLAGQSSVSKSFSDPLDTWRSNAEAVVHLLECVRKNSPHTRFYQASTSELYGIAEETPQRETTPFRPRSPYAAAKLYAYWTTVNYREAYGFHASNGILFNHEGPRRGETFVTRKITRAVAGIAKGKQNCLYLGNLDAKRDWGHAKDHSRGMWMMLQQTEPDDFVLATGESHSVREFVEHAFSHVGRSIAWHGRGIDEVGQDATTGETLVKIDPRYFRPTEVESLCGDASKAHQRLGWRPAVGFEELVREMVDEDMRVADGGRSFRHE